MRFFDDGPSLPMHLLAAQERGDVVFLCGAGVSVAAGLPNFEDLARQLAEALGAPADAQSRLLIDRARRAKEIGISAPTDVIISQLQREYTGAQIERALTEALRCPTGYDYSFHRTIIRLSRNPKGSVRFVTTNVENLFELSEPSIRSIVPPLLPDLGVRQPLDGIVYLHGKLGSGGDDLTNPSGLVLGSGDFGRAYLAHGWAARFLRQLLTSYSVVLVGYSANDPPVQYLLEGLAGENSTSRHSIYALIPSGNSSDEQLWKNRGVQPVVYSWDQSHSKLWATLNAWADLADDLPRWRDQTINIAQKGPCNITAVERGQVVHLVSNVEGAKAWVASDPPPPAEWLCVFDRALRYGQPRGGWPDQEHFDPLSVYGLDDDPPRTTGDSDKERVIGIDVLAAHIEDENTEITRHLSAAQETPLPPRLFYIARWISLVANHPATIWWAASKHQLHGTTRSLIATALNSSNSPISPVVRKTWHLLFESLEASQTGGDMERFRLIADIKRDGWQSCYLRDLVRISQPSLRVKQPIFRQPRPPTRPIESLSISDVADFDLTFPDLGDLLRLVPDNQVAAITKVIRESLLHAASVLEDIRPFRSQMPTLHPEHLPGEVTYLEDDLYFLKFAELFERLRKIDSHDAEKELAAWPKDEPSYFLKLRIWAWKNIDVCSAAQIADGMLSLSDDDFWDPYCSRELLWTLRARWKELSDDLRKRIEDRLLTGRP